MDEERMWKGFYDKLQQELNVNPITEHESRLQDSDGGFFEKFGSLLKQKSCIEEHQFETALAKFEDDNDSCNVETDNAQVTADKECFAMETLDLGEAISIGELENRKEILAEKAIGMNIEELYEEVLFEVNNSIGCDSCEVSTQNLLEFVQEVFKIPDDKHEEILELARRKEPPKIRLNVEIIKAENLMPKDCNGLSDPFVTLYLESNASHRYNSSVKPRTLNPIWEEHFSLPIAESPREEVLIIEVWDFDAAESVKEKIHKVFDVKGVKGLSKLMKEIALTASTGKHDNELIGRAVITLKSIPVSGITYWYNLEKGSKTKSRGSLLINLALSAEKNKYVAVQEHRHLLNLLLLHELESSQVAHFWWSGTFNVSGEALRSQHAQHAGLSSFECALSEWVVYGAVHEDHPLSFGLFNKILEKIAPVLKQKQAASEDSKVFWEGVKCILPSCFSFIRKLRAKTASDKYIIKTLCEVLDILSKLRVIDMPNNNCDLFPSNVYGWLSGEDNTVFTIDDVLIEAIHIGAKELLEHILEGNKQSNKQNRTEDVELQYLIKIIQLVRSDLQKAIEYFDKHFHHFMRLNYSTILFKYFDNELTSICKSIIVDICGQIKRLDVPNDDQFEYLPNLDNLNMNMGTTLFEVYLILKRFLFLGKSLCPNYELKIENFYQWFMPGVTHWLDISIIKALIRINKAIELDKLRAVDETVKYSSSAVDTLAIFYQIKIFWQQLDWPDIEGCYTFVAKIVDDICRCCVFYAQRMSRRIEGVSTDDGEFFIVSTEWCYAINNIDYIHQSLPSFVKELDIDKIITQLAEYRTNLEAERCSITIKNVVNNALDTEKNQILELLEIVARKMAPSIRRFLAEGAEVLHEDSNSMEKLMMYLERSLETLYNTLNELNFARVLDAIWVEISVILYELIQSNLDKRRPPAFFQNLRETLRIMISSFKIGDCVTSDIDVLRAIEKLLDMHALETADLIHQYYIERLHIQKESSSSQYGQLTIQAQFTDTGLKLKILNARNLLPMDSNGSCDSFVKAELHPTTRFVGVPNVKTAVKSKTQFPLYDEEFTIILSDEQVVMQNSLILFSIKDKDLFGIKSQYIAECYITFADLMASENEQMHLILLRPEYSDSETIRALEHRQGDKQARDFLKKLKSKACQ